MNPLEFKSENLERHEASVNILFNNLSTVQRAVINLICPELKEDDFRIFESVRNSSIHWALARISVLYNLFDEVSKIGELLEIESTNKFSVFKEGTTKEEIKDFVEYHATKLLGVHLISMSSFPAIALLCAKAIINNIDDSEIINWEEKHKEDFKIFAAMLFIFLKFPVKRPYDNEYENRFFATSIMRDVLKKACLHGGAKDVNVWNVHRYPHWAWKQNDLTWYMKAKTVYAFIHIQGFSNKYNEDYLVAHNSKFNELGKTFRKLMITYVKNADLLFKESEPSCYEYIIFNSKQDWEEVKKNVLEFATIDEEKETNRGYAVSLIFTRWTEEEEQFKGDFQNYVKAKTQNIAKNY